MTYLVAHAWMCCARCRVVNRHPLVRLSWDPRLGRRRPHSQVQKFGTGARRKSEGRCGVRQSWCRECRRGRVGGERRWTSVQWFSVVTMTTLTNQILTQQQVSAPDLI